MTDQLFTALQQSLGNSHHLERELGGGGMSRVFLAEETAFGRKVVVKVLPTELARGVNLERFRREIGLAARLQHPHIVPVINAGMSDGLPYFTMPFVEGITLGDRIAQSGVSVGEALAILTDVAKALVYAHERGIVHRDIKPDNVLLAGGSATVADFGIAKALTEARTPALDASITQVGTSIGTPLYMAPEQAACDPDADHRADIYSFGCVAWELLVGEPVFGRRTTHGMMVAHATQKAAPVRSRRPDVPEPLSALIARMLAKDPAMRPQSAGEVLRTMELTQSAPRSLARVSGWVVFVALLLVLLLILSAALRR